MLKAMANDPYLRCSVLPCTIGLAAWLSIDQITLVAWLPKRAVGTVLHVMKHQLHEF